ncbi:MAG: tetratricopeptide repeat protein [Bacteriovoracia bacterium]
MKFLITLTLLCLAMPSFGEEEKKKSFSEALEGKRYYYSALNEFFYETYYKEIINDDLKRLEELLFYTGIELLEDYDSSLLEKYPTSSTRFILGRQALQKKKYKKAIDLFAKIHPDHRYFPEGKLLLAQVYDQQKNYKERGEAYDACQKAAEKHEEGAQTNKIKRYYRMVYEICLVNKARHHFKVEEYQEAINAFDKIPKKSYKWPYLLLEKAWVYYQMGDYNRTLGLLTTYKSPLLDTYFFPEAEYLAALAYFRLCLYEDSLTIINQFYKVYRPRFQALSSILKKNRNSQNYFYNLMFKPGDELKNQEEFVKQIVTRMKKQTRFSLDFNAIFKINQEMKRIEQNEKPVIKNKLLPHLAEVKENMISKINYNAKTDIFQFLDTIPFLSQELFKLNLEIISRKKDLVYMNKTLIADRSRGDYSNVKRNRFEYFWKFHGAFWADELGDYSLGLKSNCKTVRNTTAGEE